MNRNKLNLLFFAVSILLLVPGCKGQPVMPIPAIDLPYIGNYSIDGSPEEWANTESYRLWADPLGEYPDTSDLEACFKASWNQNKLVMMFEVKDNSFVSDTLSPWKGDAIEIFLSPFRGSESILQLSVIPYSGEGFVLAQDRNTENSLIRFSAGIKSFTRVSGNKRITEIEIPFEKDVNRNQSFALQVYIDDSDTNNSGKNQLVWYPVGHSYNSSFSMFSVNLTDKRQGILSGSSRLVITDNQKVKLSVFGASTGDKIGLYQNGKFLINYISGNKPVYQPDTFDISSFSWDTENDSLFVTINGKSLFLHDLFRAPRKYVKLTENPFDREIRNFIACDRRAFPPKNATLFIGSSSIVRWENLKTDFPELQIIKRGFGGSTSQDALMYMSQIVLPYEPSKIVYYEGDNDIPKGLMPEEIRDNIRAFILQVAVTLPNTRIYILSPKPSINRMQLWEKYKETQVLLKQLPAEFTNVAYIDVSSPMFDQKGVLNHSIFTDDGIHMNREGYVIWTKAIRNALELDK